MKSENHTFLGTLYPAESCYLREALLWRAFARLPEAMLTDEEDWRFSGDIREDYNAPIPDEDFLYEEECLFAGIPVDPRMAGVMGDRESFELTHYDKIIEMVKNSERISTDDLAGLLEQRNEAVAYHLEVETWFDSYNDHVDQFQSEIGLALRQGTLVAKGTELPHLDHGECDRLLESRGEWLDDIEVTPIPKECWMSSGIDWKASALKTRDRAFIWVHLSVSEVLQVYPPNLPIKNEDLVPMGTNFALVGSALSHRTQAKAGRGRPSLPWDDFHIEVARMFRDDEVPQKKEAAIAALREWFLAKHRKEVSRAAVGQKLKPYYDELIKKDRK